MISITPGNRLFLRSVLLDYSTSKVQKAFGTLGRERSVDS
jgi:hypothetical protein